ALRPPVGRQRGAPAVRACHRAHRGPRRRPPGRRPARGVAGPVTLRVDVVTIFPDYYGPLDVSLLGKARAAGLVDIRVHDLRRWTDDVHRTVDDAPYGGGPGLVMSPEPCGRALDQLVPA